jgi:hypothetical protein
LTERKILVPYRVHQARQILESVEEPANTAYYLFAGKSTAYEGGDSNIAVPTDTESYVQQAYKDAIFGKRVTSDDLCLLIPRSNWVSNTTFDQYDDEDEDLYEKQFYATVNAGSFYHTYKCLYNAGNTASTIEPDFDAVSESDPYYETSDGYIWKYMYSVDSATVGKFATSLVFPLVANADVVQSARSGAIDIIDVTYGGNNYSNYLAGNNEFSGTQLRLDGNTLVYDISGNTSASSANDFYNGGIIYIKGGNNNEAGQYREIVDYFVNATVKAIVVESSFSNALGIAAKYDIYPGVTIEGDGSQTVNAVGRAIVNSVTNTVHRVEMLNNGLGYTAGLTAEVATSPEMVVNTAVLRVISSPYGGHGHDPEGELGATKFGITVEFDGDEAGLVPGENDFRSVGLLVDPTFSNVAVFTASRSGTFLEDETVRSVRPIRLGTSAVLDSTSDEVTDASGDLDNQFDAGDTVMFSVEIPELSSNSSMLATVESVTNSSHMVLTTNASFTQSNVHYYLPREDVSATVQTSNSTTVTLDTVVGLLGTDDIILGVTSGAIATVNSVSRSGVSKGFETFVNANKYVGTIASGTFVEDEVVSQETSGASGTLHSVVSNTTFYVTNQSGVIDLSEPLVGATSGAIANLTEKHGSEIDFMSGEILYVENFDPVERDPTQKETFKLVFEF